MVDFDIKQKPVWHPSQVCHEASAQKEHHSSMLFFTENFRYQQLRL